MRLTGSMPSGDDSSTLPSDDKPSSTATLVAVVLSEWESAEGWSWTSSDLDSPRVVEDDVILDIVSASGGG